MTERIRVVQIDEGACTGCGACVEICPRKILYNEKPAAEGRERIG